MDAALSVDCKEVGYNFCILQLEGGVKYNIYGIKVGYHVGVRYVSSCGIKAFGYCSLYSLRMGHDQKWGLCYKCKNQWL